MAEIQFRLNPTEKIDHGPAQGFHPPTGFAIEGPLGQAVGQGAAAFNQCAHTLRLGNIQFAVQQCPASELARLGSPALSPQQGQGLFNDIGAAMHMQFAQVFARVGSRPTEG